MHKISLPIDTKSLYINIQNDNLKGHTCTVATPIRQGKSINTELSQIYRIPNQIDFLDHPALLKELTKNSKSIVKINNVFVFDKLKVNGIIIDAKASFCVFIKEEIDPLRAQYGRIKLHYPTSLKYEELNIDNKKVINKISEIINGYAALIESFEYDFEDNYLNFKVLIVGYPQIPYSKVFISNKGVGSKFNTMVLSNFDSYDSEIIAMKKIYGQDLDISSFQKLYEDSQRRAVQMVHDKLQSLHAINIKIMSELYPYSLFDIQYEINDVVYYAIIKFSYSNFCYFDLSAETYRFINLFNNVIVFYINEFNDKNIIHELSKNDIDRMKTMFLSIRLIGE